jgi:predicted MPP superfamily phosphohydrolase
MLLFLTSFLLLYGGLHAYGFFKAKAALSLTPPIAILLAVFMVIVVLTPVIVHFLENSELIGLSRFSAYVGYTWMALIFLFFVGGIIIDAYNLITRLMEFVLGGHLSSLYPSTRLQFFLPFGLSLLVVMYGFIENSHIRIEKLTIPTSSIPASVGTLKIAQISDVHLGLLVGETKLKRILDLVSAQNPDVLVSTGDLVDGEICKNDRMVEILRGISPPLGKFAVTGNHEYYAGVDRAVKCMQEGGFKVLQGESVDLGGMIHIAGVDDPTAKSFHRFNGITEKSLLSGIAAQNGSANPRQFVLLLKHQPRIDRETVGLYDLQLSGHTHKGQIFPFSLLIKLAFPQDAGLLKLTQGSNIYISRGTGTWGPPLRFLAPPEITIIELVHAPEKPAFEEG